MNTTYFPGGITTFEQERREVFASLMESLGGGHLDRDGLAACAFLLRHLVRTNHAGVS